MPKAQIISAGFLIISSSGQVLIVKPTGKSGTTGGWGIPKGKRDPGEDILNAAIREVQEETGLNLSDTSLFKIETQPFHHYRVKNGDIPKLVFVFRAYCDKDVQKHVLHCKSLLDNGAPEIGEFSWVTPQKAQQLVVRSQIGVFDELLIFNEYNA